MSGTEPSASTQPVCEVGERLPNADSAVVEIEKIRDYVLNASSEVGRHKARTLQVVLGYRETDAERLRAELAEGVQHWEVSDIRLTRFGPRYTVPISVIGHTGVQAVITTGWEIDAVGRPRLLTAYIRSP